MLYGRQAECAAVDRLLEAARAGRSGVLSRLAEAAEERPLVCLLDDAQWLDQQVENYWMGLRITAYLARHEVMESELTRLPAT